MPKNAKRDLHTIQMAEAHGEERRETRHKLAVEIVVEGVDAHGEIFHLGTVTRDVSEWGCSFLSLRALEANDIIAIKLRKDTKGRLDSGAPTLFQVVRVQREPKGWLIATWKLNDEGPWTAEMQRRIAEVVASGGTVSGSPALRTNRRDEGDGE